MIVYGLLSTFSEKFAIDDFNLFVTNVILAAILFVIGLILGWFLKVIVKRIIEKAELEKTTKKSFINLFLTVIKWSIYILFIILALDQLGIPQLTSWLTSILVVIPALVGALILLGLGFAISAYLRDIIEENKIIHYKDLSMLVFYFVIYVFSVFALKTALISLDTDTVNVIVVILTAIVFAALAFWHIKRK